MEGSTPPAATEPAQAAVSAGEAANSPLSIRMIWLLAWLVLLVAVCGLSMIVGARAIPLDLVWRALTDGTDGLSGTDFFLATAVLDDRLPRTVAGLVAGAGLGVAGALIQAVTRNPLADPGILGVTAGSAFAVAMGVGLLGLTAPTQYLWLAFAGALVATVVVYLIGAVQSGSVSIARLTLAGVALAALLNGITSSLVLTNRETFDALRSWQAGSLKGRDWEVIWPADPWYSPEFFLGAAPWVFIGIVLALLLGSALNAIALGDDLASSLGANVMRTRTLAVVGVTLMAGGATAIAGPITFVGLMLPHVARRISGPDQRWILAYCVLLGPILLLTADILGRVLLPVGEVPAGVVTAVLGAPVLIWLARRYRVSAL